MPNSPLDHFSNNLDAKPASEVEAIGESTSYNCLWADRKARVDSRMWRSLNWAQTVTRTNENNCVLFLYILIALLNIHFVRSDLNNQFHKGLWSPVTLNIPLNHLTWTKWDWTLCLTIITSIGIGTGNLALYLSFSSFTIKTTNMITMDMTRSQMLVLVIWPKTSSRVYAKETLVWIMVILGMRKSTNFI